MYHQFLNQASSQLSYMSIDELKEIFGDDDKLDERIDEILKPLENEKDVIITENRALAESNLQKEPNLIELRSRINDLAEEFRNISENVQTKLIQLKSKSDTSDPESILAKLRAASSISENDSDQLADEFFEGNMSIDDFLEKFKVERTKMHLRKLKAEKMQELLRRGAHHNPTINFPPAPTGFYGQTPYPTNMPSFPMPSMRPPY